MKETTFKIIFLLFCATITSCNGVQSIATSPVPSFDVQVQTPTTTRSPIPSASVPTVTPITATPTRNLDELTPTPSQSPISQIEQRCITTTRSSVMEVMTEGTIFLARYQRPVGGFANLMILNSQDKFRLLNLPEFYGWWAVSPDNRWLTYWDGHNLNIVSSEEVIEASHPFNDRWFGIQRWLDSRRIVINHTLQTPIGLDVFNPFENEVLTLEPGFKDFWKYDFESSGWRVWKLVYDPTLTRVAYIRDANGPEFVLYDLKKDRILWQLKRGSIGLNDPPEWSADGKQLEVIASNDPEDNFKRFQLFTLNFDGTPTQWVDIPSDITFSSNTGAKWSPDNQSIAFYGKSLYVLDMKNHQLVDYCIPPNPDKGTGYIVWAPDSTQLIYIRAEMPGLLVDLKKGFAVSITDDPLTTALGWLKNDH
jgi:hypothetical protein